LTDIESKKVKILFYEIVEGKSQCLDPFTKDILYIKHFGEIDSSKFENYYLINYDQAVAKGLPTTKDQYDYLIKEGLWSEDKEKQFLLKKDNIKDLVKAKDRIYLSSKIEKINKDISKLEIELKLIEKEKSELMGLTAEIYARNKMEYHYIYNSFYIDEALKKQKFAEDNFDIESTSQFNKYVDLHNNTVEKFNIKNIQKLAISDFMQSMIGLSESKIHSFFGKPIIQLSFYQSSLFLYGKYFYNILSLPEAKRIKDETKQDPEKLMDWFLTSRNLKNKLQSSNIKEGMVFVNEATEEDLKGLNEGVDQKPSNLDKLAKEKGGQLGLQDLVKFFKK